MKCILLKPVPFPKDRLSENLEKHGIRVNRYAEEFFAHPAFSTERAADMTVAVASLREIGLEGGATLRDIFRQAEKAGLRPCPANAGLFLRLAWKDQPPSRDAVLSGAHRQPDGAVTVLSEPIDGSDAFPKGLYLRNVEGRLWLRGYVCDSTHRFSGDDRFAFAKPVDASREEDAGV